MRVEGAPFPEGEEAAPHQAERYGEPVAGTQHHAAPWAARPQQALARFQQLAQRCRGPIMRRSFVGRALDGKNRAIDHPGEFARSYFLSA
jgi:hypothetical protein